MSSHQLAVSAKANLHMQVKPRRGGRSQTAKQLMRGQWV